MTYQEYINKRNELLNQASVHAMAGEAEKFNELKNQIDQLDAAYEAMAALVSAEAVSVANQNALEDRAIEQGALSGEVGETHSNEYRRAFMDFCKTGRMSNLLNAAESTSTADAGVMIPKTVSDRVVKGLKAYGGLYSRVTKTNVKGGVSIPVITLRPTATWIGENASKDAEKQTAGEITFSYHGLECKVAQSLIVNETSVDGFEDLIVELMIEAMTAAMEKAIITGTGIGQPEGIKNVKGIPSKQKVSLNDATVVKWEEWKKAFAKLPLAYKKGALLVTSAQTFEGYLDAMVDSTGRPVSKTIFKPDSEIGYFGSREVVQVEEDVIVSYDDAAEGDIIAILMNPKNYIINSNLQFKLYRYIDQNTNQVVNKVICIADGKLVDPKSLVVITKGAN